jgi:hypothetical protein
MTNQYSPQASSKESYYLGAEMEIHSSIVSTQILPLRSTHPQIEILD